MLTDNPAAQLILIVEDDGGHAELIQRSFEDVSEEYQLEIVSSVSDAKVASKRRCPGLVLTDYRLPDGNGSELVLMASGAWPVIIMTSHGNEQVAVEAMKIGAQDYIVKSPDVFERLPQTVSVVLKTWSLTQARRQADEAVKRAKRDWERTFDAVPDLISIIDANHTITRVNKAMADRCGLRPEELIGRKCFETVHNLHDAPSCCPSMEMMRSGKVCRREIEEKRLSGVFDVTVSPIVDDDGSITACVHVMRDITAHKMAEEALRVSEEKHRKLANEQQIILNTSSVGICFLKDRKVLWANPAFDTIFGYEAGTSCNLDTAVFYPDNQSYEYIGQNGYSAIASGGVYSQDIMMQKKDGSLFWCNLVGQTVTPGKVEEGSIWIMQDISARKNAEQERLVMEQQFQQTQKLESLGVLAGGIAHDFNNILTIILGHSFMVKENSGSGMTDKDHVQQIENAANRAAELCRQMLVYAGKSQLLTEQINLWLLIDEIVKMLQSAIKKNVAIQLDLRRDVPEISGDNAQIQQVVMNLVINAAEAIGVENGTIHVTLARVSVHDDETCLDFFGNPIQAGGYACLEVSDNGCGMEEETLKRIFEPFYTTKFTGRGLGMSAILGIIKSHNGALQLTSRLGVGSTFKVYFPLPDKTQVFNVAQSSGNSFAGTASGTVLLVDDEEALRNIGSTLLGAMGFSTITASNGREALDIYRELGSGIDLILLDLIMPVMGGIDALRELRKLNPCVPIIICSGYGVEEILEHLDTDMYVGTIQKPYKPEQLLSTLQNMLKPEGQ